MHLGKVFEAEFVSAIGAVPQTRFLHERPPLPRPAAAGTPPWRRVYGTAERTLAPARNSGDLIEGIARPAKTKRDRRVYAAVPALILVKSSEFANRP